RGGTPRAGRPGAGARAPRPAEQQRARQAAADRSLRERNVGSTETHPHKRQQHAVGHVARDRREGFASRDRPDGDNHDDGREHDLEREREGHARDPPRRPADAMSCETVALASSTRNQTQTSLRPSRKLPVCGSSPSTTRPSPRLSALVSACNRVSASGNRSRPTVPARKKKAPAETAAMVPMSSAKLIRPPLSGGRRSPGVNSP